MSGRELTLPVITLEVGRMQHVVKAMLLEQEAMISEEIQGAVDRYCTPENIRAIVDANVIAAINEAMKEEVRNLFTYSGPGRQAIREAVQGWIAEHKDNDPFYVRKPTTKRTR